MTVLKKILFVILLLPTSLSFANTKDVFINESYTLARKKLLKEVYQDNRQTIYCQIPFDQDNNLIFPEWFDISKVADRYNRLEIEHIIPAESFGIYIKQWWQGDIHCLDKANQPYKGRRCAEKTSRLFRLMQADMYNLYPSVGSVNAVRGNLEFAQIPAYIPSVFGPCQIKIADKKIEIPDPAKGIVARVYLYFEQQYPFFKISEKDKMLFTKWDSDFPVTQFECLRTYRIETIQNNENKIVKQRCIQKNLWPYISEEK